MWSATRGGLPVPGLRVGAYMVLPTLFSCKALKHQLLIGLERNKLWFLLLPCLWDMLSGPWATVWSWVSSCLIMHMTGGGQVQLCWVVNEVLIPGKQPRGTSQLLLPPHLFGFCHWSQLRLIWPHTAGSPREAFGPIPLTDQRIRALATHYCWGFQCQRHLWVA
jgi:hypothetical protein